MIKEARGFGNTINEAKEDAIAALGAGIDDDIQFEVITTPKKKILGLFGGCKAEVRVYIEKPDKPKHDRKGKKQNNEKKPAPQKNEAKPVKAERAAKPEKTEKAEKKPAPQKAKEPAAEISAAEEAKNAVDASLIPAETPTGRAIAYLKDILTRLGCENLDIKAAVKDNGAFIIIDGDGIGVIIGHRGETLDALQYLAGLAANNGGGYFKISLNIGNYREKREQTLVSLANRVAQQVISTGRNRALEPMNPYERRIIHTAVQSIDGVISSSVGEGNRRRVVIAPEGGEIRPPKRDNRGGRGGRDRKPSSTVATVPSREPKKDSDMPLYGKIN